MLKKQLEEFKTFAMRGNVIDLAVGVIIGGAFGKITTSLVNDIIMPLLGITLGGVKFSQLSYVLKEAETVIYDYLKNINSYEDKKKYNDIIKKYNKFSTSARRLK